MFALQPTRRKIKLTKDSCGWADHDRSREGGSEPLLMGRIILMPGMAPAEHFSTLVHELAHEMLHCDARRADDIGVRETEAEAVAFVVSQGIGLDTIGPIGAENPSAPPA